MPAQILLNVVQFVAVPGGGGVAVLPHELTAHGAQLLPQLILLSQPGFTATADTVNVTVTNNNAVAASVQALVWNIHTIAAAFLTAALGSLPFVASPGSSAGGILDAFDFKAPCRLATTVNIALAGLQVIDGVLTVAGDRVLVKNQAAAQDNGIYVASAGAWVRSTDADTDAEVSAGLFVIVTEGAAQADTGWVLATNNPIVVGVTLLSFAMFNLFLSGVAPADVTKAAAAVGVAGTAARADHKHDITTAAVVTITDATNAEGVATTLARSDHTHSHGARAGGALHALVVPAGAAGFMSGADKTKLDGILALAGPAFLTWGNSNIGAAADTRFMTPGRDASTASLTAIYGWRAPQARSFRNLRVRHNTAAGNGNPAVYTLRVNGALTLLAASRVTGAIGDSSNLVNVVAVVAGDLIEMVVSKALGIAGGGVDAMVALEIF